MQRISVLLLIEKKFAAVDGEEGFPWQPPIGYTANA